MNSANKSGQFTLELIPFEGEPIREECRRIHEDTASSVQFLLQSGGLLTIRDVSFDRFKSETRVYSKMFNPNEPAKVPEFIQSGQIQSCNFGDHYKQRYFITRYIESVTWKEAANTMGISDHFTVAARVAGILEAVQKKVGLVVHRDVKPENVLITPDQQVMLTDFELAFVKGAPSITIQDEQDQAVLGTRYYLHDDILGSDELGSKLRKGTEIVYDQAALALALFKQVSLVNFDDKAVVDDIQFIQARQEFMQQSIRKAPNKAMQKALQFLQDVYNKKHNLSHAELAHVLHVLGYAFANPVLQQQIDEARQIVKEQGEDWVLQNRLIAPVDVLNDQIQKKVVVPQVVIDYLRAADHTSSTINRRRLLTTGAVALVTAFAGLYYTLTNQDDQKDTAETTPNIADILALKPKFLDSGQLSALQFTLNKEGYTLPVVHTIEEIETINSPAALMRVSTEKSAMSAYMMVLMTTDEQLPIAQFIDNDPSPMILIDQQIIGKIRLRSMDTGLQFVRFTTDEKETKFAQVTTANDSVILGHRKEKLVSVLEKIEYSDEMIMRAYKQAGIRTSDKAFLTQFCKNQFRSIVN